MPKIEPNHDFLGLIGIEFEEGLRLYGVAPRFWYKRFSSKPQYIGSTTVRILRQNEKADFGNDEFAKKECAEVKRNIKRIKTNYLEHEVLPEYGEVLEKESNEQKTLGDSRFKPKNLSESPAEVIEFDFKSEEILVNLFNLCEFYRKNQNQELLVDSEFSSNSLPLFQFERFIALLEENTRELRRTYRTVVEQVGSVRGKITTRGMMMMVARPSPRIECEFETFDIQSPIYRVMMTTLDVIRSYNLPESFKFLDERFQVVSRRAANLRSKLIEIPSFPPAIALRECSKLRRRLPRTFKQFEKIIPLAEQIILNESEKQKEKQSEKDSPWWHITAPSSKIWELLLEKSMELSSSYSVKSQEELIGPWEGTGIKNVDLRISSKSKQSVEVILLDAKYSVKRNPPSSNNQYQQFFYAAASTAKGNPPYAVALAHPAMDTKDEQTPPISHNLVSDISDLFEGNNILFGIWSLRFPQPSDLVTSDLSGYLLKTKSRLVQLLENCRKVS